MQKTIRDMEIALCALSLGLRYDGIMALGGAPLALFTDTGEASPSYGTTLAIAYQEFTWEALQAKLAGAQARFGCER